MSEAAGFATVGLFGVAGAAGMTGIAELLRSGQWRHADGWRDPSPRLFRVLLPLARVLAERIHPGRRLSTHALSARLDRAGMGYAVLPEEWMMLRGLTALTAMIVAVALQPALRGSGWEGIESLAGAAILGGLYPGIWLRDQGLRRQKRIARQFPALLELLGLSVRAGMSFSAALPQCSAHLERGPLREEMQRVEREIRTGVPRLQALERMANRIDLGSVQGFVAAIAQADETGAAISETLTDQAAQRRRERFAAAEKKANEAPVKMLAPLVGLLFPVTFLIIGFPIAIQFLEGGML